MNDAIQPIGKKNPNLPFHPAVRAGDYIFVSGQVAKDESGNMCVGNIEEETRWCLETVRRVLKEAAKKHNVCTQMGNQGSAENGLRRAVELVQGGIIGPVKEAHVWTNRPIWPQAPQITARPDEADVWPGPA